eukprot:396943-Rhodomonas_salina.1
MAPEKLETDRCREKHLGRSTSIWLAIRGFNFHGGIFRFLLHPKRVIQVSALASGHIIAPQTILAN